MTNKEFKHIFIPLAGECENYLKRITKDHEAVADAVQDTFLSLWQRCSKLKIPDNPKAFLLKCARNKLYDKLGKTSKEIYSETEHKGIIEHETTNLFPLEQKELFTAIKQLIETLPDSIKEVVHLRDINELEYDEICEITGLSYANVRVCISRGRKLLQKAITNWYKMDYHEIR